MITVNSSGSAISAGFITALTTDNTEYQARLLDNGTLINCAITRLTVTKGSCGSTDAFTIGNVIGSTLTAELKDLSVSVKGKELEVQIGVKVNGSYEYVTLGYFTVSEAPSNAYKTTITAYGSTIAKTGDAFVAPQTQSLGNIASVISTSASALAGRTVSVTFDSGINTSKEITETMVNMTCYQALETLCIVCGGFAVDTYNGNIKICRFSTTANLSRDTSTMKNLPVVEEDDFAITGVVCTVKEETTDEDGNIIPAVVYPTTPTGNENVALQNQYVTQDLYTSYLATLTGYQYRPATVGLTYGDPRLEGVDVLSVTDINSNVYKVPCHLVTHKFDGGFTTEVVSANGTKQANEVASGSNLTQTLSSIGASAVSARASAETAKAYAEEAKQTTDEINAYATLAGKTVTQILADGETAGQSAQEALASATQAQQSASTAYNYASVAVNQLSVVEDIVGVLSLVAENGTYTRTQDTEPLQDKWYFIQTGTAPNYVYQIDNNPTFEYVLTSDSTIVQGKPYYTRSGSGTEQDPYIYTIVASPVQADIGTYYEYTNWYYYELTGVDSAIQNYVSSHLVLAGNSLFLQTSDGQGSTRLELNTTNGMTLYDQTGSPVARYGTNTIIGDEYGFHVKITNNRLSFYRDNTHEVAYISGDKLYITQSVVLQQMDIGTSVADDGLGQWSWKVHEVDGMNNLYLKWLG